MALTFPSERLTALAQGMTLEQANEVLDEALAEGKVHTASGRVTSGPLQYYGLRLLATGSHQYEGVKYGTTDAEDIEIRKAAWTIFRNTEKPDSQQRQGNTDTANRQTRASRGSQSRTIRFEMPTLVDNDFDALRDAAMTVAEEAIGKWIEDWSAKVVSDQKAQAVKAVQSLQTIFSTPEQLMAAIPTLTIAQARNLLAAKVVQEPEVGTVATEEDENTEGDSEDTE